MQFNMKDGIIVDANRKASTQVITRKVRDGLRRDWQRNDELAGSLAREALTRSMNNSQPRYGQATNAVTHSISTLCNAVLKSMDVRVPYTVSMGNETCAYTDFSSIKITIGHDEFMPRKDGLIKDELVEMDALRQAIHFVKGVTYHEAGHILFTTPFPQLLDLDYNKQLPRTYTNALGTFEIGDMVHVWNIFEDQRMECAMVRYSPMMKVYFTTIVLDYVVAADPTSGWFMTAGRTYLPKVVLEDFRQLAHARFADTDPTLVRETADIISRYKRETDRTKILDICAEGIAILNRWRTLSAPRGDGSVVGRHRIDRNTVRQGFSQETMDSSAIDEEDDEQLEELANDQEEQTSTSGNINTSVSSDNSTDGDDSNEPSDEGTDGFTDEVQDPAQDPSHGQSHDPNFQEHTHDPVQDVRERISQYVKELKDESPVTDHDVKEFMSTFNDEFARTLRHNTQYTTPFTSEDLAVADEIYRGMMSTFDALAVQVDPSWRFRQEDGVLDPTAFVLRDPGDMDYWAALDDSGSKGFNLAVSVVLDTSFSMGSNCLGTGVAAMGIRKACDALNIPCTVSTFDSTSALLWGADEEPREVWAYANGGTNPLGALDSLNDQRYGKDYHLVIVLTDGEWDKNHSLAPFAEPGRFFLAVGLGVYEPYLLAIQPDAHAVIDDPKEFPNIVTNALIGYMV